jgi:polyisoprenoid-binding protein YceI
MKYTLLLAMALLSFTINSFGKGKVVATVELSPIGSFEAKSSKIRGRITKNTDGTFTSKKLSLKVTSLKTGIDLRDTHLHKSMLGKKFKKIVVTDVKGINGKGSAKLMLRGVTKPIRFKYKDSNGKIIINFSINLDKYKFEDINYKGVGVENKLKLEAIVDYKK